jgi:AraC-like DNA-binding protein
MSARPRPAGCALRSRLVRGESAGARWEMAVRPPSAALRPYVCGDYVGYVERTPARTVRWEFPAPFVVFVTEFGPPVRIGDSASGSRGFPGGFVAGLDERPAVTEHDGFQQGVQVNLTPIGARRLFALPMSELKGLVVSFRDLLPRRYWSLPERLAELSDWDARLDLVEGLLEERVSASVVDTGVVGWAVGRIEESGGGVDMRSLARDMGFSRKHVITLFRDQVGIPPKLLARLVRFDRLARHIRAGRPGTWAELALDFGYYDQAHLVREVKEFTGRTPTQVRPLMGDFYGLHA